MTHFSILGGFFAFTLLNKGSSGLCAVTILNLGAPWRYIFSLFLAVSHLGFCHHSADEVHWLYASVCLLKSRPADKSLLKFASVRRIIGLLLLLSPTGT